METNDPWELWRFLPRGYAWTIALEAPILWFGLSPGHSPTRKLLAALWLTACTYPIVVLVLPLLVEDRFGRTAYLAVAETFAPVAEVALFLALTRQSNQTSNDPPSSPATGSESSQVDWRRDAAAIVVANLTSFLVGSWIVP